MKALKNYLKTETSYFNRLSYESRQLFLSYALFNAVNPLLSTFLNIFLWRQSQNIFIIIVFNIAIFIGLPGGFYLNGLLLKRLHSVRLYRLGIIVKAISSVAIFFVPSINYQVIIVLGLLSGLASGLYWANRNFLTLLSTTRHDRLYFASLDQASANIIGIIVPLLIGGIIYLGQKMSLYPVHTAYHLLGLVSIFILYAAVRITRKVYIEMPRLQDVPLSDPRHIWQRTRIATTIWGTLNGILTVLPSLMVVVLVGSEGSLGSLQSIAAVITSVVLYGIARTANPHFRARFILLGTLVTIAASLIFVTEFSALGVFVFFAVTAIGAPITTVGYVPLIQDIIEIEERDNADHHYSYIFDQEVFVNIGRIAGLLLFLVIAFQSRSTGLRYTPLIFSFAQLVLVVIAASLSRDVKPHHLPLDDIEEIH